MSRFLSAVSVILILAPQARAQAPVAASQDALSRRPAASATPSISAATSASSSAAAAPKPAPAPPPAVEPTPDIELWLGERVGRFGDYEFPILGGKPTHPTPTGAFKIEWKSRKWWSRQYDAPMPYSCFFKGGAAIHEGSLRTMSHGCVHVSKEAAQYIFSRCKEKVTRVIVYP